MSDYHVSSLFKLEFPCVASDGGASSPISPKRKSRHWRVICPVSLFNRHLCTTYITCHLLLQAQGIQNKVPALRKLTFWWGRPQTNIYIKMCQVVVSAKKMDKVGQGEWLTGWGVSFFFTGGSRRPCRWGDIRKETWYIHEARVFQATGQYHPNHVALHL